MIIRVPWLPLHLSGLACYWFIIVRKGHDHIIEHEKVHIDQMHSVGLCTYLYRYVTDSDFRYDVEYQAYRYGSAMTSTEADKWARKYI